MSAPVKCDGVSVALCTRNGARYLAEQLESICAQDLLPREIVLSDDDSSDGCVAIAERVLAGRIPLTVLRHRPPLGVARNFEAALRACRWPLIALCDQDDVWHAGRLRRMAAEFHARPELLLLHTDARMVDGALQPLGQTLFHALQVRAAELAGIQRGDAFEVLLRRNLVTGATTMLRSRLRDVALPVPPAWIHDEWLAAVGAAIGRVDVLPLPTIDYRQHGANQIGARRLTLSEKIARSVERRGDKHWLRWQRAQQLMQRLELLEDRIPARYLEALREKVAHQRFRAELPPSRWLRPLPIAAELCRGRYARFSRMAQALAQDLLERG